MAQVLTEEQMLMEEYRALLRSPLVPHPQPPPLFDLLPVQVVVIQQVLVVVEQVVATQQRELVVVVQVVATQQLVERRQLRFEVLGQS
jgi:hypothetical protein